MLSLLWWIHSRSYSVMKGCNTLYGAPILPQSVLSTSIEVRDVDSEPELVASRRPKQRVISGEGAYFSAEEKAGCTCYCKCSRAAALRHVAAQLQSSKAILITSVRWKSQAGSAPADWGLCRWSNWEFCLLDGWFLPVGLWSVCEKRKGLGGGCRGLDAKSCRRITRLEPVLWFTTKYLQNLSCALCLVLIIKR